MDVHTENKKLLNQDEIRELLVKSQAGDKMARDILIERNVRLVWSVIQRFLHRGYESDDLFQIGCIGLMKAIDKFDLTYEVKFSTYAVPMIIGEVQRFLRDDGTVKVSRSLKELANKIRATKEVLTRKLERSPTISEIANELQLTNEEIAEAQEAARIPQSIHETVYENGGEAITLIDQLAENVHEPVEKLAIMDAVDKLPKREQLIIFLRYYQDQTQAEVAARLNISQVQVSRLEKKILRMMRISLDEAE